MLDIQIKHSIPADLEEILAIHRIAFNEEEVATLTDDLLKDETAEPLVSLVAWKSNKAVGHILFTRAEFKNGMPCPKMHILAPLAVLPEFQKKGVGGKLIHEGLKILKEMKIELVFVLGHQSYYPKYGFLPDAGGMGLPAPYPIPEKDKDAWMVQSLTGKEVAIYQGQIKCAKAMDKPEYWRE